MYFTRRRVDISVSFLLTLPNHDPLEKYMSTFPSTLSHKTLFSLHRGTHPTLTFQTHTISSLKSHSKSKTLSPLFFFWMKSIPKLKDINIYIFKIKKPIKCDHGTYFSHKFLLLECKSLSHAIPRTQEPPYSFLYFLHLLHAKHNRQTLTMNNETFTKTLSSISLFTNTHNPFLHLQR